MDWYEGKGWKWVLKNVGIDFIRSWKELERFSFDRVDKGEYLNGRVIEYCLGKIIMLLMFRMEDDEGERLIRFYIGKVVVRILRKK